MYLVKLITFFFSVFIGEKCHNCNSRAYKKRTQRIIFHRNSLLWSFRTISIISIVYDHFRYNYTDLARNP